MQSTQRMIQIALLVIGSVTLAGCFDNAPKPPTEEELWFQQKTIDSLVFVKGGTFRMGDVGYIDENGNKQRFTASRNDPPNRDVTLTSYYIQKYEVSFRELDFHTDSIGAPKILENRRHREHMQPHSAAKGMTWAQARAYCQWTGDFIGLPMDLATEAQWEYAARSRGLVVAHATDDGTYDPGRNVRDSRVNELQMPPGSWPPNPLGLYDMTGNVDEWTLDWFITGFPFEDETNPTGPDEADVEKYNLREKVRRGGGIVAGVNQMQLYLRVPTRPDSTGSGSGIRCVANYPDSIDHLRTK